MDTNTIKLGEMTLSVEVMCANYPLKKGKLFFLLLRYISLLEIDATLLRYIAKVSGVPPQD